MTAVLEGLMQDKPLLISDMLRYAERYHGEREIVSVDARNAVVRSSYRTAAARARKVANALRQFGIAPGDRVATLSMNHAPHFELFYGVSGSGAVLHTVNPRLFEDHLVYILNHAEDRLLFYDAQFAELVARLAPSLTTVEAFIRIETLGPDDPTRADRPDDRVYEDVLALADDDFEWPAFDERTASSLCYTSGTTGNPKGVLYSHRSTVLHAFAACQNSAMGLSCFDTIMPIAPMFHANAWSTPYLAPMLGAKLVLPGPDLSPAAVQGLIEAEGVTFTVAVPTVFTLLLEYLEKTGKRIETLRQATIGGTSVPPSMIDLLQNKYGCFVAQVWGMTELSPLGTMTTLTPAVDALPPEQRRTFLHKQGRAQFGLDLRIVDENGREVPHDGTTPGDLLARGPWAASAYFKNDGANTHTPDGWLRTGDVATIDPYGYIEITDRQKDLIKSGGEWISSAALEKLAHNAPGISLVAAIAAPHPKWQERPLLVIKPERGATVDPEAVLAEIRPHVAKWWVPDGVVLVDDMPMTGTGKIRKDILRDRFRDAFTREE